MPNAPLKQATAKLVRISASQRAQIKQKCHNRLNWTDGGHWMGSGTAPNCFIKDKLSSSLSHTYKFPTDAAARKWNNEWEKAIRYAGHIGTVTITAGVTLATSGVGTAIAVGTLAAIVKDELQALVPYPKMSRGWSYEVIFKHDFEWSPHPFYKTEFKQTITSVIRNHNGQIEQTKASTFKFSLDELPDGLGRLLASTPNKKTMSIYS